MKKLLIILTIALYTTFSFSECVHEKTVSGLEIKVLSKQHSVFVETKDALFVSAAKLRLIDNKLYKVQLFPKKSHLKSSGDYNSKYIEYYTYIRIQEYLKENQDLIKAAGMEVRIVGKSLQRLDLYAVTPINPQNKKTILMFGRHHGDEGTANWIIEGFFNEYLHNKDFRDKYQLILYPMINPDGATAHTRYNSNGRDLNRSWHETLDETFDETYFIHKDLKPYLAMLNNNIFIALDMHGSIREDFIYRVKRNYVSTEYYNQQQNFIDELSVSDPWQKGNFILSNGDSRMARMVLIDFYKKNAMTHESIKNIPLNNNTGRTKQTLIDQGLALFTTISTLY